MHEDAEPRCGCTVWLAMQALPGCQLGGRVQYARCTAGVLDARDSRSRRFHPSNSRPFQGRQDEVAGAMHYDLVVAFGQMRYELSAVLVASACVLRKKGSVLTGCCSGPCLVCPSNPFWSIAVTELRWFKRFSFSACMRGILRLQSGSSWETSMVVATF
jgi:hypothetical protein